MEGKDHQQGEPSGEQGVGPGRAVPPVAQLAQQAAEVGGFAADQIKAVGLGLPGLVDNKTGYVIQTPNMPFDNTPIREMFQAEWDVPVYLGNDANCAAIGEYWAGAAKDCDPAVVVTLGTGIGGGLVVGGKLYTGFAQSGLEVGHMIIRPNGVLCGCGNRGCWEQYGSATALIRIAQEAMERDPGSVMWELCQGDRFPRGRTYPLPGCPAGGPVGKEGASPLS